jgi:hypothetical protein
MRFASVLTNPYFRNARLVVGHLSVGFGFTWFTLMTLELWRPGAVAGLINLNCLLAAALTAWVVGERSASPRYALEFVFAILLVATAVTFVGGSLWLWWVPLLALGGSVVVVRTLRTT